MTCVVQNNVDSGQGATICYDRNTDGDQFNNCGRILNSFIACNTR